MLSLEEDPLLASVLEEMGLLPGTEMAQLSSMSAPSLHEYMHNMPRWASVSFVDSRSRQDSEAHDTGLRPFDAGGTAHAAGAELLSQGKPNTNLLCVFVYEYAVLLL